MLKDITEAFVHLDTPGTPGKIFSENIEIDLVEYASGWSACTKQ